MSVNHTDELKRENICLRQHIEKLKAELATKDKRIAELEKGCRMGLGAISGVISAAEDIDGLRIFAPLKWLAEKKLFIEQALKGGG